MSAVLNGAEIRARYRVDAEVVWEWIDTPGGREYKLVDVKAPIVNRVSPTGGTSRVWLPPGRSAVFFVKREHLAKYLMVFSPINMNGKQTRMILSQVNRSTVSILAGILCKKPWVYPTPGIRTLCSVRANRRAGLTMFGECQTATTKGRQSSRNEKADQVS